MGEEREVDERDKEEERGEGERVEGGEKEGGGGEGSEENGYGVIFFFRQRRAYEISACLEFGRVLVRSVVGLQEGGEDMTQVGEHGRASGRERA